MKTSRIAARAIGSSLLLSAAALAFAGPLWAEGNDPPARTPVDDLADHLAKGQRDEAIRIVARVETMTGLPRIVTTPTAFVDRMMGCEMTHNKAVPLGKDYYHKTRWKCDDGEYHVDMFTLTGRPIVEVAEFSDPARIASLAANPRPTVPPPAPPAPPKNPQILARQQAEARAVATQLCNALGTAMVSGKADGLADLTTEQSRYVFAFHDPFAKAQFVERDGEGLTAAQEMIDHARNVLGKPRKFTCNGSMVKWDYGRTDRTGFAFFTSRGGKIGTVDMRYGTREKLFEAQRNAAEASAP